ncbi:MAG TPA: porin, partial [Gammaproteobacteria bacterium]|nr:porin [Gammaproteobacteria bacterium]
TYNFSDNTFVRAELSMVSSDNKIFTDDNGNQEDTKTSFALQAGFIF